MHSEAILDTSAVIALPDLTESDLPQTPLITAITLAELSAGPLLAKTSHERAQRQLVLQQVEADFTPIPFDEKAARHFGKVSHDLRRAGRKTRARAYDALIAATALAHQLPIYTSNPDDFKHIEGLDVEGV